MISVDLRDPHLAENARAIMELRAIGIFSDEEIQRMYDEQVRRDAEEVMADDIGAVLQG